MTPLERLREAAAAAEELGLLELARAAGELVARSEQRLGFTGDVYVMALVGGTGVGKSSVLNALAGEDVSPARVLRPTTQQPLAWVASDTLGAIRPLLDWLGVEQVVGHDREDLSRVAILDLPDIDSVRTEHRATVDALLPRIDTVAWVVDQEKYDDERIHSYLRQLARHADRMQFVFNKSDRLDPDQQQMLVDDLGRRLAADGLSQAPIWMMSAREGSGVVELRAALARAADGKAVVAAKLNTDATAQVEAIAQAAGLEPGSPHIPLLAPTEREEAIAGVVKGALVVVDLDGVSRQMQEAVLHRARLQGGSLLARILTLLSLVTGRKSRQADPGAYLVDWRRRGGLGHALNPVRAALIKAAGSVPGTSRPSILRKMGANNVETEVTKALDRSTRQAAKAMTVPDSMIWPVMGFAQMILGAGVLVATLWYLTVIFGPGDLPVSTIDVPYLGPVPTPLVLLGGGFAFSLLLGFLLRLHAAWIGRRTGIEVAALVRGAVAEAITTAGFGGVDAVESARHRLASMTEKELD